MKQGSLNLILMAAVSSIVWGASVALAAGSSASVSKAAASAIVSGAQSANEEFEAAYQREYAHLAALKASLQSQKQQVEKWNEARRIALDTEVQDLEKKVSDQAAHNELSTLKLAETEKTLRNGGGASPLESTLREARKTVAQSEARLDGRVFTGSFKTASEVDGLNAFAKVFEDAKVLSKKLSETRESAGVFREKDGHEVQGAITRVGGVSFFGRMGDRWSVLVPDGKGGFDSVLTGVAAVGRWAEGSLTNAAEGIPAYFAGSLNKKGDLRAGVSTAESLAGAIPMIWLVIIAITVAGLFLSIARV